MLIEDVVQKLYVYNGDIINELLEYLEFLNITECEFSIYKPNNKVRKQYLENLFNHKPIKFGKIVLCDVNEVLSTKEPFITGKPRSRKVRPTSGMLIKYFNDLDLYDGYKLVFYSSGFNTTIDMSLNGVITQSQYNNTITLDQTFCYVRKTTFITKDDPEGVEQLLVNKINELLKRCFGMLFRYIIHCKINKIIRIQPINSIIETIFFLQGFGHKFSKDMLLPKIILGIQRFRYKMKDPYNIKIVGIDDDITKYPSYQRKDLVQINKYDYENYDMDIDEQHIDDIIDMIVCKVIAKESVCVSKYINIE